MYYAIVIYVWIFIIKDYKNITHLSCNTLDVFTHLLINFTAYFLFLTILGAENYANFIFISLICGVGQS